MSMHDELKSLHQVRDYEGICAIYDRLENIHISELSEWDCIYLMNGLYKLKRYEDCLKIYKICRHLDRDCDKLNDKMGWCVYHLYLRDFDFKNQPSADFFEKADYVLGNIQDGKFSPMWRIVKIAADAIVNKSAGNRPDYARANDYLNRVDRENLSRVEGRTKRADGKNISMASDYETWFSMKTKCLLKMAAWEECIRICDEGLSSIEHFHYNNDSWFKYRKALCLLELGQLKESLSVANEILKTGFRHWSIYQLLYDIAAKQNDSDAAMKYAGYCALSDSIHEMRIKFYEGYADFLDEQGLKNEAMLHLHLVVLIKQEKGWKLKEDEQQKIDGEISRLNKKETLERLRLFWQEHRDKDKVYISGTVSKLLPSGRDGFIKDDAGNGYYFNFRDVNFDHSAIEVGLAVKFTLEERLDKRKNVWKKNAVDVKLK